MTSRTRKFLVALVSPLLTCGVLYGIVTENRRYLRAEDFEPYHVRAKKDIESIPMVIGSWIGEDASGDIPREAQVLLKPNIILSRRYKDFSMQSLRQVHLLIVQCKESNDMLGHFPPICYPSHGFVLTESRGFDFVAGADTIRGMEYQFTITSKGQTTRTTIYNFLLVPGRGIYRDMDGVKKAAKNYQQRYYGAAQFQLVFQGMANADLSKAERDAIFRTLMEPIVPVTRKLNNGAMQ